MDELVAMRQAGLSDQQILDRMRATGQVFELTPDQQAYLRNNGVDQYVIDQAPQINHQIRDNMNQPVTPPPAGAPVYQQQGTYPQGYNPSLNTPVPPPPGP
jgi:hypothetical protein